MKKFILKLVLVLLLIFIFKDQFLDSINHLEEIGGSFLIGIVLFFYLINNLLNVYRFRALLKMTGIKIKYGYLVKINFISMFFGLILPGVVGSDIVKASYLLKIKPESKYKIITSILIDRLLGLIGLIIITAIFVLFIPVQLFNEQFEIYTVYLKSVIVVSLIILLIFLFVPSLFYPIIKIRKKFFMRRPLQKILIIMIKFSKNKMKFLSLNLLSVFSCFTLVLGLSIVAEMSNSYGSIIIHWALIPFGIIVSTIPISPAGIGISQVGLNSIYQIFSQQSQLGFLLMSIYQICIFIFSIFGLLLFLFGELIGKDRIGRAKLKQGQSRG
jgi:uncharacterized membrane protein YbhN (UPF0104 family)